MKKIRKINMGSAALFGGVLAGVYVFFGALLIYILEVLGALGEGKFLESFLGLTAGTFIGVVLAGVMAFVAGAVAGFFYALVYNVVANITGGLEIELTDS